MPDSRATMVSASSERASLFTSESAGTVFRSITGVIGSTLSSRHRTAPVCDSVAAVADGAVLPGRIGQIDPLTRMDLNIGGPPWCNPPSILSRVPGAMQRFFACFAEPDLLRYQTLASVTARLCSEPQGP